jgi:hypothetical protein
MIVVRLIAALVVIAFALVAVYLWKKDRRYLRWAWRVFLLALFGMLGLLIFYFAERLLLD